METERVNNTMYTRVVTTPEMWYTSQLTSRNCYTHYTSQTNQEITSPQKEVSTET